MTSKIHPTAIISPAARIAENVEVGPYTIIHGNVNIAADSKIGAFCEIGVPSALGDGTPLILGERALIRSHSVLYESSAFGPKLVTGHRVTIREKTKAGENLQVGTLSDIQGDVVIGDFVRFHSNVHVGKMSKIGNYVWIFPYVVLTNDPTPPSETLLGVTVGDYAVIATMSVILPGVNIGEHSLVAASACVGKDVPVGSVVGGVPAKVICETRVIKLKSNAEFSAYPWPRHFKRGYPEEVLTKWDVDFGVDI
jgi:UDP-3-O-[3-hydroxymyristoyl] glucosamine N-acyltransferase